jgi:hypothetical protein
VARLRACFARPLRVRRILAEQDPNEGERMSGWGWFLLGSIYLVLLFTLAVMTFRKGHWILGLIGFFFPILWIIGAILPRRSWVPSQR